MVISTNGTIPPIPEEYTYDANGNLKSDRNKGITDITYNSLNLPMSLSISNALGQATNTYVCMGDGRKLKVSKGSFYTDYVGNMIYENGVLKRILVDNGYYENENYYFYIQDHLGNNGVVTDQSGNIVQSTQYYPFGMAFTDGLEQNKQPYKYNGKELDTEKGLNFYDYSARYMDPALGRFTTMDPMAEKYYNISPYTYCLNNPIKYIDPDGNEVWLTMYSEGGEVSERIRYTAGMKYKGKNEFFSNAVSTLNKMNSTEAGATVIEALSSSDYKYLYTNIKTNDGSAAVTVPRDETDSKTYFLMGGGTSLENTAHELYHGYQIEKGVGGQSVANEAEAYAFGYAVAYNYASNNLSENESQRFLNNSTNVGVDNFMGFLYDKEFQNLTSGSISKANSAYSFARMWFKSGARANETGVYKDYPYQGSKKNPGLLQSFLPLIK